MAVIDRVIRTLRDLFKKVFVVNGNYYWLDDMYKIERNYNNSFNSSINTNQLKYGGKLLKQEPPWEVETLNVGDYVRILLINNNFEKKNLQKWSRKIYQVVEKVGVGYMLNGEKRKYFINELLKVYKNSNGISKEQVNIQRENSEINRVERVRNCLKKFWKLY